MHFAGDLSKSSKWALLHLKEVPYWHRAGSGLQEAFNRMHASGKKTLVQMDSGTIEVWAATALALAMQHSEKKSFWLGKPKSDPPDMAIMTVTDKGYFLAREIEVTRCTHPDEELVENILKKDRENKLSDKYVLCGFVESPGHYDLMAIGQELQGKLTTLKNVVLVFNGKGLSSPEEPVDIDKIRTLWTVAQISPVFDAITIDIAAEYKSWLSDPEKLIYVRDRKIYYGKKTSTEQYPTLLSDTPVNI